MVSLGGDKAVAERILKMSGLDINDPVLRSLLTVQVVKTGKRFHSNTEGKGLGLFMVKTQAEVLGGSIGIESQPGAGTEFTLELPE